MVFSMKTLLAYYSFSNATKELCEKLKTDDIDLYEIKEVKKRSVFSAYTGGCYKAIKGKPSKIQPVTVNPSDYDLILVASSVWASSFAPGAIAFIQEGNLKDKNVVAIAVSASGHSTQEKIKGIVDSVGAKCINIYDVKKGSDVTIKELKQ